MQPDTKEGPLLKGAVRADVAGVSLELIRLGKGRPLLFLHGMDGVEGSLDVIRRLSTQFDVFAPSHPGFGASELPASFDAVDDIAYLYLDLLETLGLNDAVVVGMSFGGWIAAEMLIKNHAGVSQLVLGAPLGIRISDRRNRGMTDIFMLPARDADQLLQVTPRADIDLASIDENRARRIVRSREAVSLFGWSPYLNDPKLHARLHRITTPTLVLRGADDRLVSTKYVEDYVRALPDARVETLDHCGHHIHIDKPERLVQIISQFSTTPKTAEACHARMAV